MINQKKTANAIGGKTARACDSCLKRRATWFCASDDAFLCGACDSLVHSANDDDDDPSSRHKRVCLDTNPSANNKPPSWHHGFTKKARTPRNNNKAKATIFKYYSSSSQTMPVVPDQFGSEEHSNHESEEDQMVFSVPNLDDYHFHQNTTEREKFVKGLGQLVEEEDMDMISVIGDDTEFNISLISGFDEWDVNYLPVGLFAAEDAAVMKGQEDKEEGLNNNKVEEEGDIIISTTTTNNDHCCYIDWSIDDMFTTTTTNNNNNNACWGHEQSQASCVQDNNKVVVPIKEEDELHTPTMQADNNYNNNNNKKERSRILLRLNYEGVISAWATQTRSTSPWINGHRPEYLLHHHAWPNCMDNFGQGDVRPTRTVRQGEEWMGYREHVNGGDGGRRARVTRYREKRRTRLFSKKIRYEVRKLNAEKRPRLKGRFVKRTSLSQVVVGKDHVGVAPSYPYLNG